MHYRAASRSMQCVGITVFVAPACPAQFSRCDGKRHTSYPRGCHLPHLNQTDNRACRCEDLFISDSRILDRSITFGDKDLSVSVNTRSSTGAEGTRDRSVSRNNTSDLQAHSRSLVFVPFNDSIGHTRFTISLPLRLCLYLAPFSGYYRLFPEISYPTRRLAVAWDEPVA